MATDTKGLSQELAGRKLRLYFQDREICEAILVSVDVHENCPFGDDYADFVYDIISTNRPDKYKTDKANKPKPVYAAAFKFLDRWEFLDSIGGY